jgi:hypothetical protein
MPFFKIKRASLIRYGVVTVLYNQVTRFLKSDSDRPI